MNKENIKKKVEEHILGILGVIMVAAYTFVVTGYWQTSVLATIYKGVSWICFGFYLIMSLVMIYVLKSNEKMDLIGKKKGKSYKTNYKMVERLLLIFCFIHKALGYAAVSWSYFIPVICCVVGGCIFLILTQLVLYKYKTNIYEISLYKLPDSEKNIYVNTYKALKEDLCFNMSIGSKEWRKRNFELAKYYYQEAINTIV